MGADNQRPRNGQAFDLEERTAQFGEAVLGFSY
jgi:hypothetical protein